MGVFLLIIFIIGALLFTYKFLRPWFETSERRNLLFRIVIILIPLSIILYFMAGFLVPDDIPASFKDSVALLEEDSTVAKKIGGFNSYSYDKNSLPKANNVLPIVRTKKFLLLNK